MEWMKTVSSRLSEWNRRKYCHITEYAHSFIVERHPDRFLRIAPWYSMDLLYHPRIVGVRSTFYTIIDLSTIASITYFDPNLESLLFRMDHIFFPSAPFLDEILAFPCHSPNLSLFHRIFFFLSSLDLHILRTFYLLDTHRPSLISRTKKQHQ